MTIDNRFIAQWLIFATLVFVTIPPLTILHNNVLCTRTFNHEQQH